MAVTTGMARMPRVRDRTANWYLRRKLPACYNKRKFYGTGAISRVSCQICLPRINVHELVICFCGDDEGQCADVVQAEASGQHQKRRSD